MRGMRFNLAYGTRLRRPENGSRKHKREREATVALDTQRFNVGLIVGAIAMIASVVAAIASVVALRR
jgi:hypothetical protein